MTTDFEKPGLSEYCSLLATEMEDSWQALPIVAGPACEPCALEVRTREFRGHGWLMYKERMTTFQTISSGVWFSGPTLLTGRSGSGKTVAMRTAAARMAKALKSRKPDGRHPVPVYVDLSGWWPSVGETGTFSRYLADIRPPEIPEGVPVIWLFDGLDQLPKDSRLTASFLIEGASELHGRDHYFVFSACPKGEIENAFACLAYRGEGEIGPLETKARLAWASSNFPVAAERLAKWESAHPLSAKMLDNPLMFSMALAILSDEDTLPEGRYGGRAGMLDNYIEYCIRKALKAGKITAEAVEKFDKQGRKMVSRLCWEALCGKGAVADKEILMAGSEGIHAALGLLAEAGLVREIGDSRTFKFVHRQIAEHFAALEAAARLNATKRFSEREAEAWRYYSRIGLDGVFGQAHSICEAGRKGASAEVASAIFSEWHYFSGDYLSLLGESEDPGTWPASIHCLRRNEFTHGAADFFDPIESKEAIPHLAESLKVENQDVRAEAASALIKMGAPELVKLDEIAAEPRGYRASEVEAALTVERDARELIPDLIRQVESAESSFDSERASKVLGLLKAEEAAPALLNNLKSPYNWYWRSAAEALGKIDPKAALSYIEEDLSSPDWEVREKAVGILGRAGGKAAIPRLIAFLADPHPRVRAEAAISVKEFGSEYAGDLIACLEDRDIGVRLRSLRALRRMGAGAMRAALVARLASPSPRTREVCVRALGELGRREAIPEIARSLNDPAAEVRIAASVALGALGARTAIPALAKCLKDASADVRLESAYSLGIMRADETVPELAALLADSEAPVRRAAAEVLGKLRAREAAPDLRRNLAEEPDPGLRCAYARALGEIRASEAIPALIGCMSDPEPALREATADALGELRARAAVPVLTKGLGDDSGRVRVSCAVALEMAGATEAASAILELLRQEPEETSDKLTCALGALGDEKVLEVLVANAHKWNYRDDYATQAITRIAARHRIPFDTVIKYTRKHRTDEYGVKDLCSVFGRRISKGEYYKRKWRLWPTGWRLWPWGGGRKA